MAPRITVLASTVDLVMRVPRSPEPGETPFVDSAELLPGGKGLNQALAAARLGAAPSLARRDQVERMPSADSA
jgi:ribokinase